MSGLEAHSDKTPILYSYSCMLSNIVFVDSCFWAACFSKQRLFHSRTCARAFGQHFASTFPSSSPVLCICSPLCTGGTWAQDWHSAMGMCFSMATAGCVTFVGRYVQTYILLPNMHVCHIQRFIHIHSYVLIMFSQTKAAIGPCFSTSLVVDAHLLLA